MSNKEKTLKRFYEAISDCDKLKAGATADLEKLEAEISNAELDMDSAGSDYTRYSAAYERCQHARTKAEGLRRWLNTIRPNIKPEDITAAWDEYRASVRGNRESKVAQYRAALQKAAEACDAAIAEESELTETIHEFADVMWITTGCPTHQNALAKFTPEQRTVTDAEAANFRRLLEKLK